MYTRLLIYICIQLLQQDNQDAWYLDYKTEPLLGAFYQFFTWFIIFAQFIPISLLVAYIIFIPPFHPTITKYHDNITIHKYLSLHISLGINGSSQICPSTFHAMGH